MYEEEGVEGAKPHTQGMKRDCIQLADTTKTRSPLDFGLDV